MTTSSKTANATIIATTIASLAALGMGFIVVRGFTDVKNANDVINVTGSAKRAITSDQAVWNFTVTSTDTSNLQNAYRNFRNTQPAVENFLKSQSFPDTELRREPVNAGPQTYNVVETVNGENVEVQRTKYVVSQTYRVQSSDINKVQNTVSSATNAFVNASTGGVNVESGQIDYLYTKLPEVRVELLKEASQDAQRRAEAIAQSAGNKVGAVKNARMGVFQITPRFETSVEGSGSYDTSSLEKDVTAVVEIDFVVK